MFNAIGKLLLLLLLIGCTQLAAQDLVLLAEHRLYSGLSTGIVISEQDEMKDYWDENVYSYTLSHVFSLGEDWPIYDRILISTDGYILLSPQDQTAPMLQISGYYTNMVDRRFYHPAFQSEIIVDENQGQTIIEWKNAGSGCDEFETVSSESRLNFQIILDHDLESIHIHYGNFVLGEETRFCLTWSQRPIVGLRLFDNDSHYPAWLLGGASQQPDFKFITDENEDGNIFLQDFPTSGRFYSIINESSSTSSFVESENIQVYPNPFDDRITFENNLALHDDEVDMYNMLGTFVGRHRMNNGTIEGLSHLPPGMYVLHYSNRIIKVVKK